MITHVLKQQCILIILYLFIFSTTSYSQNVEPWLGTGDLFNVKINMTINDVILELGEPLFLETISDEDEDIITSKLYYNFRTKEYSHKNLTSKTQTGDHSWGRNTTIQFLFINDQLLLWEEDKLTLSMSNKEKPNNSIIKYFGLLWKILLTWKVFT